MIGKEFSKKITALGGLCGITSRYWDNFGRGHRTSQATYRALLSAMGVPWEESESLDQEIARRRLGPWGALVEPVELISPAPAKSRATLRVWSPAPEPPAAVDVQAELVGESGERRHWETRLALGSPERREIPTGFRFSLNLPLPADLELGYYDLTLRAHSRGRKETGRTRLIAAPPQAYAPEWLEQGPRFWGFNLPLYAIKSRDNWGVGDFADLMAMMRWAGDLGAAFVGVNPDPFVPYKDIYRWKRRVLERLYQAFCTRHGGLSKPRTIRGQEFARFAAAKGDVLTRFGHFCALADHLQKGDWRRWPEPYRDPDSPAVAEFVRTHPEEVGLFQYGQWLAETQLTQVCQAGRERGLPFTLYEDLALGANPGGFDTWAHQDLFALDCAMGAPPDAFNPKGQYWGLPPMIPERLRASGYQLFIDTLRANLRSDGMLRMDHVMGLFRLLWIPRGAEAVRGAYVRYPQRELLAILALESVRRRALIIGEDLGTVPPHIRRKLAKLKVFSYRVFYFERDGNRHFLPPEAYPSGAMATVTTHDLPTLAGFWQGNDLALKQKLKLYPTPRLAEDDAADRDEARRFMVAALKARRLLPEGAALNPESRGANMQNLRDAVLTYLAESRAALMEVRLEDIFGVAEQQNLPGTQKEHPNWRLKLPLTLDEMTRDPEPPLIAARLNAARSREK
ncbi:MAG: 4-alpha-glucanotransferase [Deltaproteobacteria bacterium]